MGSDYYRNQLTTLDREITALHKKDAEFAKKEADLLSKINRVNSSINKNTSTSSFQSKMREIERYENDRERNAKYRAENSKKIADKQSKRNSAFTSLQKEQLSEQKANDKKQADIQKKYVQRIDELTEQINIKIAESTTIPNFNHAENEEKYDAFISHASEDKESFADGLFNELQSRGLNIWYDSIKIGWGDGLRATIDEGLKKSKFGIVVLSSHFINKGWTNYELDGLFQKELNGNKTILPIWHNISKDEVMAFSPSLANKKALSTTMFSTAEIADELGKLLV